MKLLLDTHALLWWLSDDDRLGPRAREIIADPANDIFVSVVSLWEIVVKIRIGKLASEIRDILAAIENEGFAWLAITAPHLLILAELPTHHRDPFDHLLIAQAIGERAIFVSEDARIRQYAVQNITCAGGTMTDDASAHPPV